MAQIVNTLYAVAQAFEVTRQTVYRWRDDGMPVEPDGTYDILKISKWKGLTPKKAPHMITEGDKSKVMSLTFGTKMTGPEIAEATGLSPSSVYNIQHELERNKDLIDLYKARRADILACQQVRADKHLTDEKLEESSAVELVNITDKLFKMERLERGETTENVGVMVAYINKIKEEDRDNA